MWTPKLRIVLYEIIHLAIYSLFYIEPCIWGSSNEDTRLNSGNTYKWVHQKHILIIAPLCIHICFNSPKNKKSSQYTPKYNPAPVALVIVKQRKFQFYNSSLNSNHYTHYKPSVSLFSSGFFGECFVWHSNGLRRVYLLFKVITRNLFLLVIIPKEYNKRNEIFVYWVRVKTVPKM